MVVHFLILGDYILSANVPGIDFHIKRRQDIGLSLSIARPFSSFFWHSAVFPKIIQSSNGLSPSRICCTVICGHNYVRLLNRYLCTPSFPGAFQLGIFLHCIFTISWLISTSSILFLFSNCFLQPFNHSACWLCFLILQISVENSVLSSEFRIILSPSFSSFNSLHACFWLT